MQVPEPNQRGIACETARVFQIGVYRGPGLMRGRLVIPIHDEHSCLLAYAGRTIDGAEPRYKFPVGFHKSLVLFNLHRALRSGSSRVVVVVEGFFDCMRVHQVGVPSVVALMGVFLSARQRDLLVASFEEVILMLDGDEAGSRATEQVSAQLAGKLRLKLAEVPAGKQPDQLQTSGSWASTLAAALDERPDEPAYPTRRGARKHWRNTPCWRPAS